MAKATRLVHCQFDHLLGPWREADVTHHGSVAAANYELHRRSDLVQFNAHVAEHLGGYSFTFSYEPEKQVLRADVVMVESKGLFLSKG